MNSKRILVILSAIMAVLIVLLCVAVATHQAADPDTPDNSGKPVNTTTSAATTTGSEDVAPTTDINGYELDDLPDDLDFGNAGIGILYWSDVTQQEFEAEAQTGELINDAIYERNQNVQNRLNIQLKFTGIPGDSNDKKDFIAAVDKDVQSGSAEYDLIGAYSQTPASLAMNGDVVDLNSLEYLNFDKPWWPSTLSQQATIRDRLYFCSGDVSTNLLWMMTAVFFNKDLLAEFGLDNPYEMVPSKQWTVDKMIEMCSGVYQDLDGNGVESDGDRYGMTMYHMNLDAYFTAAGLVAIDKNSEGELQVSQKYNSETVVNLIAKMGNWVNNSGEVITATSIGIRSVFGEGRSLFITDRVFIAKTVMANSSTFGYGILPVPLYSSEQDDYTTNVGYPFTMYSVSSAISSERMDRAAATLECMASESYRTVTPAVFETAMKIKYSEDEEASSIYDMLRTNVDFDPGRLYVAEFGSTSATLFRNCVLNNNNNWSSQYASIHKVLNKGCELINKTLGG